MPSQLDGYQSLCSRMESTYSLLKIGSSISRGALMIYSYQYCHKISISELHYEVLLWAIRNVILQWSIYHSTISEPWYVTMFVKTDPFVGKYFIAVLPFTSSEDATTIKKPIQMTSTWLDHNRLNTVSTQGFPQKTWVERSNLWFYG